MDRYYSIVQMAKLTGFSRQTIYKAIEDGELPYFKPRGCKRTWRIAESDMERWIRSKTVRGA